LKTAAQNDEFSTVLTVTEEKNEAERDLNGSATTTGCGPGELVPRTIASDIHIDHANGMLGNGRFGQVWLGKWQSDPVAVKVFFSMHEASWARETSVYQTCMLRHENILGYIASDIIINNSGAINMLIITDYHANGSLYDYLESRTIDKRTVIKFAYTVINGLNHLHKEILGTNYKPFIAHRDLKTKNVLVKENMECCIADFGLAVRYDSQLNRIDACCESGNAEGSVRYMAPEILDNTIDYASICDLKKADMYAYALVLWELLTAIHRHMLPFFEHVNNTDVTVETMRDLVCVKSVRPESPFGETDESMLDQVRLFSDFF
jgi:serine/threonine protein kinase